jgi:uroporphyrinogen decarboxylase
MHALLGAPHRARDLFRRGADDARVIARAARDAGAEGVILGEDVAYGRTTYIAPNDLRELYFPYLRELARQIRALGLAVFFHSDGNLNAILDDLAACELDGIQGLEPAAGMDIGAARARVGDALTLWGNLGYAFLSAPRTDAEMDAAVRATQSGSASRGKIILGSCSGLVPGMNIETVRRAHNPNRGFNTFTKFRF